MIRGQKVHDFAPGLSSMSLGAAASTQDPSRRLDPDPKFRAKAMQDTAWADGLRGVASVFVVASHLVLCYARKMVLPCCGFGDSTTPLLFQRPPFRLLAMGHSWVAIFFILLGFVNSLKPLKLARARQSESAANNLAVAALRRAFRLVLPATLATTISWFICQLGMYETARNGDAYWLYRYTPAMSPSWGAAIGDLFAAVGNTWLFQGVNPYDQPQWALIFLLQASMMVILVLLVTIRLTPLWRTVTLGLVAAWSMDLSIELRDPLVGVTIIGGICLAELSLTDVPQRLAPYSPFLSTPLIALGLLFMSQPSDYTENAWWSDTLAKWGRAHFPRAAQGELHRTWGSLGALMLVLGIMLSPLARRLLSSRPLAWLGRISFPIYLLHGIFVRSVLAWLMFRSEPATFDQDGTPVVRYPQRSEFGLAVSTAVSMGLMLVASHYWTLYLEPVFASITARTESLMVGRGSSAEGSGAGKPVLPVRKE